MFAAAVFSLLVALAIVSVPRVMYRLVLGASWQITSYRQWAVRTGVLAFCLVLVMCGLVGLPTAAWAASAAFVVIVGYYGRVAGKARRLQAACKGLLGPATRDASLAYIRSDLDARLRRGERSPNQYPSYARTALVLASALDTAGLRDEAIRMVRDVDAARLDPLLRAMRAQNLAAFCVRSGDRAAARAALATLPRPVRDPTYEDALSALDALLAALDGDARDAETRARRGAAASKQPNVVASWRAALAHALAAQGSRDEALEVLRQIRAVHGETALERVALHAGPASPLAESLRAETGVPYR